MFLSRTTGYVPNPTECVVSDGYFGPWNGWDECMRIMKICLSEVRFHLYSSTPRKRDLYIALADRWLMNLPEDLPDNLFEIANSKGDDRYETLYDARYDEVIRLNTPKLRDMSAARYVWLPILFENGKPVIRWFDEWKWEDFE